jgi:putative hydrolase of the HAD superfamily
LQEHLGLDEAAAGELRRHYWQRYGATLIGLMRHHATDPQHFLRATHNFPELAKKLVSEPGTRATLMRLPGRKLVFSNSPVHYSLAVLDALGISDLFDDVFSIEHTHYRPKPDSYGFLKLFRKKRVRADACIMVEDSLENLKTAKKLECRPCGWRGPAGSGIRGLHRQKLLQLQRLAWHLH